MQFKTYDDLNPPSENRTWILKSRVDKYIDDLKSRIHELESKCKAYRMRKKAKDVLDAAGPIVLGNDDILIADGTFIDEDKWIERKKNSSEIIEDRLERKNQAHAKCKTAFIVMKDGRYVVGLTETQIGAVTIKETLERRHPSSEYKILGQMTILSDEFIAIEYEPTQIEKDLMAIEANCLKEKIEQSLSSSEAIMNQHKNKGNINHNRP